MVGPVLVGSNSSSRHCAWCLLHGCKAIMRAAIKVWASIIGWCCAGVRQPEAVATMRAIPCLTFACMELCWLTHEGVRAWVALFDWHGACALCTPSIGQLQPAKRISAWLCCCRAQAVAQAATGTGARGLMSQWQRQAALAAAQKGLTSATMRYSAVQSALAFLGPVMWAWLAVDLVRAAVGTDYARVVRAVYILAQVREWQDAKVRAL
jgi:hypothetical protein